jgi:prevent-host-death family protein
MREYTFTEARQNFASVLDEASQEGVVCVRKRNGQLFYIKPVEAKGSPLDVEGVDLGLTSSEIVDVVREGRQRQYD